LLKDLILECLYPLNESRIAVKSKKEDFGIVKKAIDEAVKEYKSKTSKDITVALDESDPLPAGSYVQRSPKFHSMRMLSKALLMHVCLEPVA
jgi:hypothetical protein